jgi:hypothetical protein
MTLDETTQQEFQTQLPEVEHNQHREGAGEQ